MKLKRAWVDFGRAPLTWRLAGTAGDEYGRKTYWAWLGFGVVVVAGRFWTWEETLASAGGDEDLANHFEDEYLAAIREEIPALDYPGYEYTVYGEFIDCDAFEADLSRILTKHTDRGDFCGRSTWSGPKVVTDD